MLIIVVCLRLKIIGKEFPDLL